MNFTYATLLTSDSYLPGVALLKASLDRVQTHYPLLVLTTGNLSENTVAELQKLNVTIKEVPQIHVSRLEEHNQKVNPTMANVWADVLAKFNVWTLTDYKKIIMCDCDLMFIKNVDHCFDLPNMTAALDGEYFNLWANYPHFNSGFFVLEPNINTFNDLMTFANELDPAVLRDYLGRPYVVADQEILNLYYKDWINKPELHLSKYYNVFAPHIHKATLKDLLDNAYFFHYTGSKPWVTLTDAIPSCDEWIPEYPYALARALLVLYKESDHKLANIPDWMIEAEALRQLVTYYNNFEEAYDILKLLPNENISEYLKKDIEELHYKEQLFKLMLPVLKKTYEDKALEGNLTITNYSKMYYWENYNKLFYEERADVLNDILNMYNTLSNYIYDEGR